MEQTNNAKARYIPTRVAVCKRCEGKGVVFEYSDENRTKPFIPGKDDKEGELAM
ncbi:hypothetical protein NE698_02550 [Bacteroides fragilis]|uniref:hypothetical protein n=1 Tax=Bacteroides fragilis TaxID=817 RepID=UPI001D093CAD|nr:hypothetical protein [Bacteroides fragilis]MCB6710905.1 hypothetical protein [Bacteroides fragilis]MCQ5035579.1 hypothetical protein [Bacteroides fragilis]MCQ5048960.1 hypothetical protein [Bacteroides fragilis]